MTESSYHDARIIAPYSPDEPHYLTPLKITLGAHAKADEWEPSKAIPHVRALFDMLAHHPEKPKKDGLAFVSGELIPGPRAKTAAKAMYALTFDFDRGTDPDAIDAGFLKLGCAFLRYSSFTNGKTRSDFARDAVAKFLKCSKSEIDSAAMQRYVREKERWVEKVAATAELIEVKQVSGGFKCFISHAPLHKNRVIVPLAAPFVIDDYENLQEATKAWNALYFGVAESIGLLDHIDRTGADLNRLFYVPRHPKGGAHDTVIAGGALLDPSALDFSNPWAVEAETIGGKGNKSKTPEGKALAPWSINHAAGFQIADAIRDHCAEKIREDKGDRLEIECPNDAAHHDAGNPDDRGCIAINAGEGRSEIFTVSCRHDSCQGMTAFDMLGLMLKEPDDWFARDVLESPDYNAEVGGDDASKPQATPIVPSTPNTILKPPDGLDLVSKTGEIKPTFENCLILLEDAHGEAWGFAYDEMAQVPMLRGQDVPWAAKFGRELNDDVIRIVRHFLIEQWGVTFNKADVEEACLTLASYNRFNPLVEYLDGLKWDKTKRVETWLVNYLGAEDSKYIRAVGMLWLVAAVRRAKKPGCKFDNMPIFEGLGGAGKSTALNTLAGDEHFTDAPLGDVENKDAAILLQGVWIAEMGELNNMSRSDAEAMLAFVSRRTDRYRGIREKMAKAHPRMCVFAGTTNKDNYLTATSGNRRYWPVKCGDEIKLDALARDRDQIWAEAVELEKTGMSLFLAKDLWPFAKEEQAERVAVDPWRDELRGYLEKLNRDRVSTAELLGVALGIDVAQQNDRTMKRLRDVMATIEGWRHKSALRIKDADGKDKVRAGYERAPESVKQDKQAAEAVV